MAMEGRHAGGCSDQRWRAVIAGAGDSSWRVSSDAYRDLPSRRHPEPVHPAVVARVTPLHTRQTSDMEQMAGLTRCATISALSRVLR